MKHRPLHGFLLISLLAVFIWSVIRPHDYMTWAMEVAPVVLGVGVLIAVYRRFRFTDLVYTLIWAHCIILVIGGHYTYAEMPVFNWLRDHYHLSRNYYDRLGHVVQGLVPALIAREMLIRKSPLDHSRWMPFLVVCFCMAFSAFYEFIEWWAALALGTAAESFLATQGDVWDTQWDMFLCMLGAIAGLLLLSRYHDRQLAAMGVESR